MRQPRDESLHPDGPEAALDVPGHLLQDGIDARAAGVAVHRGAVAGASAEQSVDRHPQRLAGDVPQRAVDSAARGGAGRERPIGWS